MCRRVYVYYVGLIKSMPYELCRLESYNYMYNIDIDVDNMPMSYPITAVSLAW